MVHLTPPLATDLASTNPVAIPSQIFRPHPAFSPGSGDVLVQSSDLVLFGVQTCILVHASVIFEDMFLSHSHAPSTVASSSSSAALRNSVEPVILSETGQTIDALLRLIYPLPSPTFSSLSDLLPVLTAAFKYSIPAAQSHLRQQLISSPFLLHDPLRVYAIACRFSLYDEAKEASRATLRLDLFERVDWDRLATVGLAIADYHRLVVLHRKRSLDMREVLKGASKFYTGRCEACIRQYHSRSHRLTRHGSSRHHRSYSDPSHQSYLTSFHFHDKQTPKWFCSFLNLAKAELERRPITDTIFSMAFLNECVQRAGCHACGTTLLASFEFMEGLKREMDVIPDTIEWELEGSS